MTEFKWYDGIEIDYGENIVFTIPENTETVKKIEELNTQMAKKSATVDDANTMCNIILDALDAILGDGATAKMFATHRITPRNCMNAWMHLNQCAAEQFSAMGEVEKRVAEVKAAKVKMRDLSVSDETKNKVLEDARTLGAIRSVTPAIKAPRL